MKLNFKGSVSATSTSAKETVNDCAFAMARQIMDRMLSTSVCNSGKIIELYENKTSSMTALMSRISS